MSKIEYISQRSSVVNRTFTLGAEELASIVKEFHTLLNNYLDRKILEDDVRCWIGYHLDEPPDEILPLFYDVTLALWDMEYARDRGYATEEDFRAAVAELLTEELEPAPSGDG